MLVLIDNGHGYNTPGKCSPDKRLLEYKYCREIADRLVRELKARNVDARLLVPEVKDVSLTERCRRANTICAEFGTSNVCLVSIHNNAAGSGQWMTARGWEAWTSPGQTKGDKLADSLYKAAEKYMPEGTKIRKDLSDGDDDKEARFTILTGTKCAACLTENLFQDNREDVDFLLSDAGKETVVNLHIAGILDYISRHT